MKKLQSTEQQVRKVTQMRFLGVFTHYLEWPLQTEKYQSETVKKMQPMLSVRKGLSFKAGFFTHLCFAEDISDVGFALEFAAGAEKLHILNFLQKSYGVEMH